MSSGPDYLAVVDAGHGETLAIVYDIKTKKRKVASFPSLRARITGETITDDDTIKVLATKYADWNGMRYAVGADALRLRRANAEVHAGENRYGNEFHRFLVARAVGEVVKTGLVDLTVFVPPGKYFAVKDRVISEFTDKGQVSILLAGDKKKREFSYSQVSVRQEGLIAGFALVSNADGTINKNPLLNSLVLIDMGTQTVNSTEVSGGQYNLDDLSFSTNDDAGIQVQLLRPMLEDIRRMHRDYQVLRTTDIDLWIRAGIANAGLGKIGDVRVRTDFAGRADDISDLFHYYRHVYANFVANNVIDSMHDGLRGRQYVHFVGGGYGLVYDFMQGWYGEKILPAHEFAHIKGILPYQWNAEAAMRASLARARKQGWI